jgi:protein CpxP
MKSNRSKLVVIALSLMLVAGTALAQGPHGGPHMGGGDFLFGGHFMNFMADYLDLTDAQRTHAKAIMDKEKATAKPVMDQLRQAHEQLYQLATAPTFDEAKTRALAAQQSQAITELIVQRTRVESELVQILTPEQRTKMEQMHAKHLQHMQEHMNEQPPADE